MKKKLAKTTIFAGIAVILVWLIFFAVRSYRLYQSLDKHRAEIFRLQSTEVSELNRDQLSALVQGIRKDVLELNDLFGPFISFAPAFEWLPGVGPTLQGAPALMRMALAGSEAGVLAEAIFIPILEQIQEGSKDNPWSSEIIETLAANQTKILDLQRALEEMQLARSQIQNPEQLPDRVQLIIELFDSFNPVFMAFVQLADQSPDLMGIDGPKNYLLLAQNEDEIRPTGGFISGVGLITVNDGRIQSIAFQNANLIDAWQVKPYDLPPIPFQEFMGMDMFLFRDANFWPDFPSSAQAASYLYTYGQEKSIDGVIAIDQNFLILLLDALGPVFIDEFQKEANASNVIDLMRQEWGPKDSTNESSREWILQRKEFMEPLAQAILTRITTNSEDVDPARVANMLWRAGKERHFQVWMADPKSSLVFDEVGWGGRFVNQLSNDFIAIVDTNMGFNKVNAVVETTIRYSIELNDVGDGQSKLSITYDNTNANSKDCVPGTTYDDKTQYSDLFNDCYWNYLRVYVPPQAELLDSSKHPIDAGSLMTNKHWGGNTRISRESSDVFKVFDNMLLVPTRETETVQFSYALPGIVDNSSSELSTYRLLLRKQAGSKPQPVEVMIALPAGTKALATSPNANMKNNEISYRGTLMQDIEIWVQFKSE